MKVVDIVVTLLCSLLARLACALPLSLLQKLLQLFLHIFLFFQPKHLRVAKENIRIAFPNLSSREQENLLIRHISFLSRIIGEALQLPIHTADSIQKTIRFPDIHHHKELLQSAPPGPLMVTGHIGSFELFAYSAGLLGLPLHFVVRDFPLPRLNSWWKSRREKTGNTVISRVGAYKEILKNLKAGNAVGVLFDQNVTLGRAFFPEWFGLPAATTKAVAHAALKTKAPVVVACMVGISPKEHRILWKRCDIEKLYSDQTLSTEEKLFQITQEVSDIFCDFIREYPEQWFWMHRRWKTRPDGSRYHY